ncbi:hypothetical protein P154DRAFT_524090 [Amniculicola lignicola CBS 123094]|uniref:C2H2-type domain-containing protein n=1 Tax=Amniculicola lignicola CBS 123094 TaxID=1392246 RepID=A0A6A5WE31_9PLEO|nr:hypothetical protein P154DRAFT_524090 [Amniculicola lignicola CBS 123094]
MDPVEYRGPESKMVRGQSSSSVSQGYLTPPPPFEGRRDSVTSAHSFGSSYCQSFTSDPSIPGDFSVPVTPTCGSSPALLDGSFVDVMQYDLQMDLRNQAPIHGLQLDDFDIKPGTDGDIVYQHWAMVQPPFVPTSKTPSYHCQDSLLPHSAIHPVLQSRVGQLSCPEEILVYSAGVDEPRENGNRTLQAFDFNGFNYWAQQPQPAASSTLMPSDVMLNVEMADDYKRMQTESYRPLNAFDNRSSPIAHSPQEIPFKGEPSNSFKQEQCDSSMNYVPAACSRLQRRMGVSPTGGKTVKRSTRMQSGIQSKKKPKVSKDKGFELMPHNQIYLKVGEGVEVDHARGIYRALRRGSIGEAFPCTIRFPDGSMCPRRFKRPEHRKRHENTHSGLRDFPCTMPECIKMFNRNDNCQEHYWTHVAKPGKKPGRNPKFSLGEMLSTKGWVVDPKLREKLRQKWKKAYGSLDILEGMWIDLDPFE